MSVATEPSRYTGRRMRRVEDPRYLTGRARFIDDINPPGTVHAAFVRSPHAHAEIGTVDASRALALDGVHAVLVGADLRAACAGPMRIDVTVPRDEVQTTRQPVLAEDKVRFLGEPVALVVADSRYLAEDAAELVAVDWRPLAPLTGADQALGEGAPRLHEDIPDNNFAHLEHERGAVEECFERAAHVFRKRVQTGRWAGNPLEPRGVIAQFDHSSGVGEVWSACQGPYLLRSFLSLLTGIPEGRLRCHSPDVGGSFGIKGQIYPEDPAILVAAMILGRPVKWIEDRVEHLSCASHAKQMTVDLALAVAADGRFLAMDAAYVGDAGAYAQYPPTPLIDVLQAAVLLPSLYRLEAVRYAVDCALTTKTPAGAARGVGWTSGQIVRETLIDEVARDLGLDPGELRLRNVLDPEPTESLTGLAYDGGSYGAAIERVMELAGYADLRRRQAQLREEGRYLGIGISPFVEPCAYGTVALRAVGIGGPSYDIAGVTVEADGSITVRSGFHSHGQGHQTTFAQLTADLLDAPIESVRVLQGDTDHGTYGMGSFGSRSAAIAAEILTLAAGDVRHRLVAVAAHLLGCAASAVEVRDGVFSAPGVDGSLTLHELAAAVYFGGPESIPAGLDPVLSSTRHHDPPESYANGAALAVVEVDPESGLVEIEHIWFSEDCGVVLNPMVVEGQLAGGAAQGIGMAVLEELVYDEHGQLTTGTLMDYLYPTTTEVPDMSFDHLETPAPDTSSGVKGAGEGGSIGGAGAVVQAVADAVASFGGQVTETPLTPERVLRMIDPTLGAG